MHDLNDIYNTYMYVCNSQQKQTNSCLKQIKIIFIITLIVSFRHTCCRLMSPDCLLVTVQICMYIICMHRMYINIFYLKLTCSCVIFSTFRATLLLHTNKIENIF